MIGSSQSGHGGSKDRCAVLGLVQDGEGGWSFEKAGQLICCLWETSSGSHGRTRLQLAAMLGGHCQERGGSCEPSGQAVGGDGKWRPVRQGSGMGLMDW